MESKDYIVKNFMDSIINDKTTTKVQDLINAIGTLDYNKHTKLSIGFYDKDNVWHDVGCVQACKLEITYRCDDIGIDIGKREEIRLEFANPLEEIINNIQKVLGEY